MRRKWYKYVLSTAVVACSIHTQGLINDTFAQQTAQPAEESGSNLEDLKWQLGLMEESAARQQEQIQAIKERLDAVSAEARVAEDYQSAVAKEDIKHAVEDYLSTDEARKEMGLGMPSLTALYTPDEDKYSLVVRSPDDKYSLGIGGRLQFRYTFKDNDEDFGKRDTNNIDVRRARLCFGGNVYS